MAQIKLGNLLWKENAQPLGENNPLAVKDVGQVAEIYGTSMNDRPSYTSITGPAVFVLMPSFRLWYSDGRADWVEL